MNTTQIYSNDVESKMVFVVNMILENSEFISKNNALAMLKNIVNNIEMENENINTQSALLNTEAPQEQEHEKEQEQEQEQEQKKKEEKKVQAQKEKEEKKVQAQKEKEEKKVQAQKEKEEKKVQAQKEKTRLKEDSGMKRGRGRPRKIEIKIMEDTNKIEKNVQRLILMNPKNIITSIPNQEELDSELIEVNYDNFIKLNYNGNWFWVYSEPFSKEFERGDVFALDFETNHESKCGEYDFATEKFCFN